MEPTSPIDEIVQKVLRRRTVDVKLNESRARIVKNSRQLSRTIKKRRVSFLSSDFPKAVNGCRKLRTRLIQIADSDDNQQPLLTKKRIVPSRKNSAIIKKVCDTATLRTEDSLKEQPLVVQQDPELLTQQKILDAPRVNKVVTNLTVTTSTAIKTASFAHQKLVDDTSKKNIALNNSIESVSVPCTSVIRWIDKNVTVQAKSLISERSSSLKLIPHTSATIINKTSSKKQQFTTLLRPVQHNQIESPYPRIYDKHNWFRPFVSLFLMLRINNDSDHMSSCPNKARLDAAIVDPLKAAKQNTNINCAIEWNKEMDKTMIRVLDENVKSSVSVKEQLETTTDNQILDQIATANNDSVDSVSPCSPVALTSPASVSLSNSNVERQKTLQDKVQSEIEGISKNSIEDLKKSNNSDQVTKFEITNYSQTSSLQPNAHQPFNSKTPTSPETAKSVKSLSSIANSPNRNCKACNDPNVVDKVPELILNTENCTQCSSLHSIEEKICPTSESSLDEDFDIGITTLPAFTPKRLVQRSDDHVNMSTSYVQPGKRISSPKMTVPRAMARSHKPNTKLARVTKHKNIKKHVLNPIAFQQVRHALPSRIQVASSQNAVLQRMQSAVHEQAFATNRSVEPTKTNETAHNTPTINGFRGFRPLAIDDDFVDVVKISDDDTDDCSIVQTNRRLYNTSLICRKPFASDIRIAEFEYNRQMNQILAMPTNVNLLPNPRYRGNQSTVVMSICEATQPTVQTVESFPLSLYASQLRGDTSKPSKRRALSKRILDTSVACVNNDPMKRKCHLPPQTATGVAHDFEFPLVKMCTSYSLSSLMRLPQHDFFAGENISIDDLISKYL